MHCVCGGADARLSVTRHNVMLHCHIIYSITWHTQRIWYHHHYIFILWEWLQTVWIHALMYKSGPLFAARNNTIMPNHNLLGSFNGLWFDIKYLLWITQHISHIVYYLYNCAYVHLPFIDQLSRPSSVHSNHSYSSDPAPALCVNGVGLGVSGHYLIVSVYWCAGVHGRAI